MSALNKSINGNSLHPSFIKAPEIYIIQPKLLPLKTDYVKYISYMLVGMVAIIFIIFWNTYTYFNRTHSLQGSTDLIIDSRALSHHNNTNNNSNLFSELVRDSNFSFHEIHDNKTNYSNDFNTLTTKNYILATDSYPNSHLLDENFKSDFFSKTNDNDNENIGLEKAEINKMFYWSNQYLSAYRFDDIIYDNKCQLSLEQHNNTDICL